MQSVRANSLSWQEDQPPKTPIPRGQLTRTIRIGALLLVGTGKHPNVRVGK